MDVDPLSLPEMHEHMIRSPPPTTWPKSPNHKIFNFPHDEEETIQVEMVRLQYRFLIIKKLEFSNGKNNFLNKGSENLICISKQRLIIYKEVLEIMKNNYIKDKFHCLFGASFRTNWYITDNRLKKKCLKPKQNTSTWAGMDQKVHRHWSPYRDRWFKTDFLF